jgi:glycerol-3-phosphate cytidylyltransferase
MEIVKAIKYVDEVIAEDCWDQKIEDVKRYGVDLFVMGSDWEGKFDFLKEYCEVVYLDRTPDISSSGIKSTIVSEHSKPINSTQK